MAVPAIASMTIGLMISAVVRTSETTLVLLFISVMLQIVLTGGVIPIAGRPGSSSWPGYPRPGGALARWPPQQTSTCSGPGRSPDAVWTHDASTWLTEMGLLILLAVVFAFITYWLLKRAKPGRR